MKFLHHLLDSFPIFYFLLFKPKYLSLHPPYSSFKESKLLSSALEIRSKASPSSTVFICCWQKPSALSTVSLLLHFKSESQDDKSAIFSFRFARPRCFSLLIEDFNNGIRDCIMHWQDFNNPVQIINMMQFIVQINALTGF
ncbi:hypothetical protein DITRI_Ditri20bG0109200 [Diplodiscus trichospermus]